MTHTYKTNTKLLIMQNPPKEPWVNSCGPEGKAVPTSLDTLCIVHLPVKIFALPLFLVKMVNNSTKAGCQFPINSYIFL